MDRKGWIVFCALSLGVAGCSTWDGMSKTEKGTAVGAGVGALGGAAVSGGSALGTAAGAAVGGVAGHEYERRQ